MLHHPRTGRKYVSPANTVPADPGTSAYAHSTGRATYEAIAVALPTADHTFSLIMNAVRNR